ncbi:MAG: iron(III) transport system substrate-binding protein [Alphaproteobacteria bacterium]|jgi:iron(III) transport system substrate-binding protein
MKRIISALAAIAGFGVIALPTAPLTAADLPKSTQAILKELKLSESRLAGLDKELEVPADWITEAKKTKKLIILSTWDQKQFRKMSAPFKERYPFIDVKYSRSSYNARVVKTLIAWKEKRYLADIVTGFGGGYFLFRDAGALEDLSDIPSVKNNVPVGMKDPHGKWVGQRLRYWCMSYNTNLVKKADLPKRWEDLLTNKKWHGGKIGLGNRPQLWLLMLWGTNGEEWTKRYIKGIIETVKPQLRKEGTNALTSLAVAGEFNAALPSAAYRTAGYRNKGAPIAWHCPEPIPLAVSEMGIIKGSENTAAAKIFTNWFLSKEGQIAQYASDKAPPVHKDLQTREFLAFPEEIIGKKIAFRHPGLETETKKLFAAWDPIWKKQAATVKTKMVTFMVKIDEIKRRGRTIIFTQGGKTQNMSVSGRRTKVMVDGKKVRGRSIKPGMNCEITAAERSPEATSVTCK